MTPHPQLVVPQHHLMFLTLNSLAIWDNRSVFHTATFDYLDDSYGERFGNRAVGLGEVPYFDPGSKSRREALGRATK